MSENLTLFNMDVYTREPAEPVIERYVVVVVGADGKSYWRRKKRTSHYDPGDEFIELDMTPPMPGNQKTLNMTARIPVKGVKLPTMFKSARGARSKVSDLYRRHKGGGEGINMWIQKWERKESDKFWKPVDAFK